MQMISIILLTIFLEACVHAPKIKPQARCGLFLVKQKNGSFIGKCRCRMYEYRKERIGSYGKSWDISLDQCNKLVGYSPESTSELFLDFDNFRKWLIEKNDKEF